MKTGTKKLIIALTIGMCVIMGLSVQQAKAQAGVSVSFQTFYDDLSPYGEWVDAPSYGYVWVPQDVDEDFRPYYSRGHWVMTEYGNTWVSDYNWGWATFHYGRWTYDDYYGWVWVPGSEWAPAWVSWRHSDSYYGWAPLSPGISIGVSFTNYSCPNDWWVFVGPQYLYRPDYRQYWRGPRYNTEIINRTTIINNVYVNHGNNARYNYGPRPQEVQRITNRPVPQYRIANVSRPGAASIRNNVVNMYHPATVRPMSSARPAPNHIVAAPRPIGRPAAATSNARPAFHTQLRQGVIKPGNVPNTPQGRPQMQPGRGNAPAPQMQHNVPGRPTPNMNVPQRNQAPVNHNNMRQQAPAQMQRQEQIRQQQAPHQQMQQQQRPQQMQQQRPQMERPQPQHMQRPQMQPQRPQQMERPQPQQMQRPQMERPQPQQMQRPQMERPQPQQMQRPQPIERPQPMQAPHMEGGPPGRGEHGGR